MAAHRSMVLWRCGKYSEHHERGHYWLKGIWSQTFALNIMAKLFGREWSRRELESYVGDFSQIAGVRLSELTEGRERGVRVADLRSGSGLNFTVVLERGLDIGAAEYRGTPLAWLSPATFAHPSFYEPAGAGWLRSFGGGLVTGCGLTNAGAPDVDSGQDLGLHGRLSNLPASRVQVGEQWDGDECVFYVQGHVRQSRLFGENLHLTRRISVGLGQSTICLQDTVENLGDAQTPLALLYHINLGFPLVNESSHLSAPPHPVCPRDATAQAGLSEWAKLSRPSAGFREQVFYHDLPADEAGWAAMELISPQTGLKCTVRSHTSTLPNFIQWKQMGHGAYVLGLEPANCSVEGRSKDRVSGALQFLEPGQKREFKIEIRLEESNGNELSA